MYCCFFLIRTIYQEINMKFSIANLVRGLLPVTLIFGCVTTLSGVDPRVKNGTKIAFMGDSITDMGFWESGYCKLVVSGLAANGIKIRPIAAGISNQSSRHMHKRIKPLMAKKPDLFFLSCGVNDIGQNVPLPEYEKNIRIIIDEAQKGGAGIFIMTASVVQEDLENEKNKRLVKYNDFLRSLAKEKNAVLVEINGNMQNEIRSLRKKYPAMKNKRVVTVDGLHMNLRGDRLMAETVLRSLGLTDSQIEKARAAWQKRRVSVPVTTTVAQWEKLYYKALSEGKTLPRFIRGKMAQEIKK